MKPRTSTLVSALVCAISVSLAWMDPWASQSASAPLVSTRSAARRVFPELADRELERATIELQGPEGPPVRLAPGPEGEHQVSRGDILLGPADPEALEGIRASLRMATTLRAVPRGGDLGIGQRGTIRIMLPGHALSLALGHEAPAANGLYAVMEHEGVDAWVVESDLAWLIEQAPEAWLSRRLLLADPTQVVSLAWGEQLGLKRGEDGLWRVHVGGEPALLSAEAVDQRIERMFSTRLDPLLERDTTQTESLRPWLAVATADGRVQALSIGGACPGDPERRLIDRGPGLLGCVPAELADPWPVDDFEAGLLESRLIPYGYGTVLAVEMTMPEPRTLRRRAGGWELLDADGERVVSEPEVYRWFSERAELEIEAGPPDTGARFEPDTVVVLVSDSGRRLTLRCQGSQLCARDDGPPRRVLGKHALALAFAFETFADKGLLALAPGEARAIEILDSGSGEVVRQSARLDLGTWRLDAPDHPDGDAALDQDRLERLLAVLSTLRAEAWTTPTGPALRRIALELAPRSEGEAQVQLDLYAGCVVGLEGRLARVDERACEALAGDLLYDDPVRAWLRSSRSLHAAAAAGGAGETLLRREGERWTGDGARELDGALSEWTRWRSTGLRRGTPGGSVEHTWTLRRDDGPTVTVELGQGFVRLAGADWYYAGPPTSP